MLRRKPVVVLRVGALIGLFVARSAPAQSVCAFVSNAGDNTVSIVDLGSGAIRKTIGVGKRPGAVAATPDRRFLYVSDTNDPDESEDRTPDVRDTLSVIDTQRGEVVDRIQVGRSPHGAAVSPDGTQVVAANTFDGTLSVIDTETNEVVRTVAAGDFPVLPAMTSDGARLFVSEGGAHAVLVIDTTSFDTIAAIPVAEAPRGIAFSPDGRKAFVAHLYGAQVSVIDTESLTVTNNIPLGTHGFMVTTSPLRGELYVGLIEGRVAVIDMASEAIEGSVNDVGAFPFFMSLNPEEDRLYVVSRFEDHVAVADVAGRTKVDTIAVGDEPRGIIVLPLPACPSDPQPILWTVLFPLSVARQEIAAAELGGRIYSIGGIGGASEATVETLTAVERYDPVDDVWEAVAPLPAPLHHPTAAVVGDKLYVLGGLQNLDFTPVDFVFAYDPGNDRWEPRAAMPAPRGAAAAAVIDDLIYVAGGYRSAPVADFAVYDPATDRWTVLPPMPTPRDHLGAAALAGKFYAVGGRAGGELFDAVEAFDPVARSWRTDLSPMPTARGAVTAAVAGNRLVAFGGEGNAERADGVFPQVEAYNARLDSWERLPDMPWPRHGAAAVRRGEQILVIGGGSIDGFGPTSANEAFELPVPACAGDCDDDGTVDQEEIANGIRMIFTPVADAACQLAAVDRDDNGTVTAADLVTAVGGALGGCAA
jgi:YVTN family beta-propeller protein